MKPKFERIGRRLVRAIDSRMRFNKGWFDDYCREARILIRAAEQLGAIDLLDDDDAIQALRVAHGVNVALRSTTYEGQQIFAAFCAYLRKHRMAKASRNSQWSFDVPSTFEEPIHVIDRSQGGGGS